MSAGLAGYDLPKFLRTPEEAGRCKFLGANLNTVEVAKYTAELLAGGIPCRQCDGKVPGYYCLHPVAGPFTRIIGKCNLCRHFDASTDLAVADVAVPPSPVSAGGVVGEQV